MARSAARNPREQVNGRPIGLTSEEAERRLREGQGNAATLETSRSYRRILFDNAFTPINTVLFVIAVLLVALGLASDAIFTAGLVLINVVVGVFQEARAKRQLDEIALLARPMAKVVRDGEEVEIEPEKIVCGDILPLQPGDQILVDGNVIEAEGFSVDESLLTGESDLVRKEEGDEVFSGTFCMTGSAYYEATEVGARSMANQITARARSFRVVRTPLQREVAWVIWGMGVFVLLLGAPVLNALNQVYNGFNFKESLRAAAVIVALVPQGLSFMVTATYAMAAVRIGRGGALVQRLNAVESMSHIDVLCLDKTGTLTTNNLALEAVVPFGISEDEARRLLGTYAASASVSNRTNAAILEGCGGEPAPVRAEIGFDSSRKWSALEFEEPGPAGVFVLGAPEIIAPALEPTVGIGDRADAWASRGLRVLLLAAGRGERLQPEPPALPSGLRPLALVALRDELRPDARETMEAFAQAGIALKIISGDNPQTVAALARQAGFGGDIRAVAGPELEHLDEEELERVADEASIFGRIAPQHKEALVRAIQRRGHYVAMTGDGVNDVPALKQSNVAIAVKSGSPVTRNVADLVLINDSFGVLAGAFSEGQRIRKGMEAIIRLFLVRTFAVSLAILGASVFADPFPITPRQSGVPAQLTVGIPALALAVWARPGKTSRYLLPSAARFVLPAAFSIALVSFVVFHLHYSGLDKVTNARTVLTLTSTLCGIALIPYVQEAPELWLTLRGLRSDFRTTVLAALMLLVFVVTYFIPPVRHFYELVLLGADGFAVIGMAFLAWLALLKLLWRIDWTPYTTAVVDLAGRLWRRARPPARRKSAPAPGRAGGPLG